MPYDDLVTAEFNALRAEILQQLASLAETTRTFLLFAATLYAVPIYLKLNSLATWLVAALIIDMTLFTMALRLAVVTNQVRRIGSYIRHVLEPKTNGAMEYEAAFHTLIFSDHQFMDESAAIVGASCVVHLLATYAVARWLVTPTSVQAMYTLVAAGMLLPLLLLISGQWRRLFSGDADRKQISDVLANWPNADVVTELTKSTATASRTLRKQTLQGVLMTLAVIIILLMRRRRRD